jgi:hypothetical protein
MTFILDVAAGVLIAAAIIGVMFVGLAAISHDERLGGSGLAGGIIAAIGLALGIALVVCRLFRWP